MNEPIFSGSASIQLQGKRALRLRTTQNDYAEYEVIGFDHPAIILRDYRKRSRAALSNILEKSNPSTFAPEFNTPAIVTVRKKSQEQLLVELKETTETDPPDMLWIAIGIRNNLPVYDYHFRQIEALQKGRFALFSLYRRPCAT